jgi:hypothetical protein
MDRNLWTAAAASLTTQPAAAAAAATTSKSYHFSMPPLEVAIRPSPPLFEGNGLLVASEEIPELCSVDKIATDQRSRPQARVHGGGMDESAPRIRRQKTYARTSVPGIIKCRARPRTLLVRWAGNDRHPPPPPRTADACRRAGLEIKERRRPPPSTEHRGMEGGERANSCNGGRAPSSRGGRVVPAVADHMRPVTQDGGGPRPSAHATVEGESELSHKLCPPVFFWALDGHTQPTPAYERVRAPAAAAASPRHPWFASSTSSNPTCGVSCDV